VKQFGLHCDAASILLLYDV